MSTTHDLNRPCHNVRAAPVTLVESLHVALPEVSHGARQRFVRWRRQKQVSMIAHEDIGVDGDVLLDHRNA